MTAVDDAGNASALPYQIRFEIGESQNFEMTVSPNPASQYVRFEARINDTANLDTIEWEVFNAGGTRVYSNQSSSISKGINEWYWQPGMLASGMYYYKVRFRGKNSGESNELTGKLILVR